jgi:enoyl-CoA hydratase
MDKKILHSSASLAYAATTRLAWLAVLSARGSTSPISPGSDFVGIPNCKRRWYSVAAARRPNYVCRPANDRLKAAAAPLATARHHALPPINPTAIALGAGRNVGGMTVSEQAGAAATNAKANELVVYETLDGGRIARIWLNRPDAHNAQNRTLLVQLDEAFCRAEADDAVRVVILAARGKNFSAGHDLGSEEALLERKPGPTQHPTFRSHGATLEPISEKLYHQEWHFFFENTCRWRDLRKITIAQVQGNAISAGLMLMWACDLIVAADNAKFSDVVAVRLGMPGVEYYAHPWEFGPRKAKELLLTGDSLDADEAYRLGMVSKVFPVDELEAKTLEFARRIAERPTMAALLIKDSVNAASDAMGFTEALRHAFHVHQLGHAHWAAHNENRFPVGLPPDVEDWRTAKPTQVARRDTP